MKKIAVYGRNLEDLLPLLKDFPCTIVDESPELVISHGGDGALLGAERKYPGIPKCPIRDRKQNPKCPLHDERLTLQKLFQGELTQSYLMKLEVQAKNLTLQGINDILINHIDPTGAIRFKINIDNALFRPQVICDSLLLATPFGSTGYFQSMTHGNFQIGMGMAFNNSLDLLGYTILPENATVNVQLLRGPALIVADNDPRRIQLDSGDSALIHALPTKTPVFGIDVFRCQDCFDLRKQLPPDSHKVNTNI